MIAHALLLSVEHVDAQQAPADSSSKTLSEAVKELVPSSLSTAAAELRARGDRALIIAHQLSAGTEPSQLSSSDKAALAALTSPQLLLASQAQRDLAVSALTSVANSLYGSATKVDAERSRLANAPASSLIDKLSAFARVTPDVAVFGPKAGYFVDAGKPGKVPLIGGTGAGPTSDYPEVAMLLYRSGPQAPFTPVCSGTLISPDMIATAAHCTCFDSSFDPIPAGSCTAATPSRDPSNWLIFFQAVGFSHAKQLLPDPKFAITNSALLNDAAVLILSDPVTLIPPVELPTGPGAKIGDQAELIGFGESFAGQGAAPGLTDPGIKRAGFVYLGKCDPTSGLVCWQGKGPQGVVAACHGDSGGPMEQLLPDETLLGITSFSNKTCPQTGIYDNTSLVDVAVRSFVVAPDGVARIPWSVSADASQEYPTNLLPTGDVYDLGTSGAYVTSIAVADKWRQIVVSVNSSIPWTGAKQPISMIVKDSTGKSACQVNGGGKLVPSAASCTIVSPMPQQYQVLVSGAKKEVIQIVAAAY